VANYNPNLVKTNRNFTFEELAEVFGVHKNTVSAWVKNGLPCLKERRPFLILGADAKSYLQGLRVSKKQRCKPNELFCVRCKAPTRPAENHVKYVPHSATKGRLTGLCGRCECVVNKFARYDSLERYSALFDLLKPKALERVNDSDNPLLNSDFN